MTDSTTETQALKLSGTPFNAQGSLDEVDAALAPLKEVSAKAGMQVAPTSMQAAPTSTQAAEAVSNETLSSFHRSIGQDVHLLNSRL